MPLFSVWMPIDGLIGPPVLKIRSHGLIGPPMLDMWRHCLVVSPILDVWRDGFVRSPVFDVRRHGLTVNFVLAPDARALLRIRMHPLRHCATRLSSVRVH